MCVRTVCSRRKRALPASFLRFESRIAAAPQRNRQLERSIERSLPRYQFCVMFSVDTTIARQFLLSDDVSSRVARSTETTEAEQPIPPRLYETMSDRMLK